MTVPDIIKTLVVAAALIVLWAAMTGHGEDE